MFSDVEFKYPFTKKSDRKQICGFKTTQVVTLSYMLIERKKITVQERPGRKDG